MGAKAFDRAKELGADLVIFDTAGRLAIDELLMKAEDTLFAEGADADAAALARVTES